MALAILGGAFDPPHNGHVALARAALRALDPERLLVLVVSDPGHKDVVTSAATRLALARLAFAEIPEAEVELDAHARTVDSLEARTFDDPVLVLGADELAAFERWKAPERVLELARLAVARRPGVADSELAAVRSRLAAGDRIFDFEMEPVHVSSSEVRDRVMRGEPIDDLVPPAVAEEIARLGLYRAAE